MSLGSCDSTGLGEGSAGVRRRQVPPWRPRSSGEPLPGKQMSGKEGACGNGKEEWASGQQRGEKIIYRK